MQALAQPAGTAPCRNSFDHSAECANDAVALRSPAA
jgi:hypothetical protein